MRRLALRRRRQLHLPLTDAVPTTAGHDDREPTAAPAGSTDPAGAASRVAPGAPTPYLLLAGIVALLVPVAAAAGPLRDIDLYWHLRRRPGDAGRHPGGRGRPRLVVRARARHLGVARSGSSSCCFAALEQVGGLAALIAAPRRDRDRRAGGARGRHAPAATGARGRVAVPARRDRAHRGRRRSAASRSPSCSLRWWAGGPSGSGARAGSPAGGSCCRSWSCGRTSHGGWVLLPLVLGARLRGARARPRRHATGRSARGSCSPPGASLPPACRPRGSTTRWRRCASRRAPRRSSSGSP